MKQKKRLVGELLGISPQKVKFAPEHVAEIAKAITRSDIRGLLAVGKIQVQHPPEHSRVRARAHAAQKRKGRQKGRGSRKGTANARLRQKERWLLRVRGQRAFLRLLREKKLLGTTSYHTVYRLIKGGYFRNLRHLKLYLNEHQLWQKSTQNSGEDAEKSPQKSSEKSEVTPRRKAGGSL